MIYRKEFVVGHIAVKILVRERDGIVREVTVSRRQNQLNDIDVANVTRTDNVATTDQLQCSKNDEMAHVHTTAAVGP